MAALHARSLPAPDALNIALLPSADRLSLVGGEPGDQDAQHLHAACRALLYPCCSCQQALPVGAYSRDSAGLGLCAHCLAEAEQENALADGTDDPHTEEDAWTT
jgi:hypothetical protein